MDWKAAECIVPPNISDHVSVATTRSFRKDCVVSLEECLSKRLSAEDNPFG